MANHPPITLRYFDARGRAQFLRYYFKARKINFTDERVPSSDDFSAWKAMRDNRSLTGPFQKLPIMHWGGRLIAETLLIASLVHEALGDAGSLSDDDNLRHGMLTSSLYQDIAMPIGQLLWAEVAFVGADLGALAKRTLERLQQHCGALEQTLLDWRWIDRMRNRRVMLADCLLWEELAVVQQVFGAHFALAATPTLAKFYEEFAGRATCETLLKEQPCPITARPGEPAVIEKIQQSLA
jgi:hypothetical protein